MGDIQIISKKIKNLDSSRRFSSYIGKKIFSKSGEYVGKVVDVIVDGSCMQGVLAKSKKESFIDRDFFESDSDDTIMLSIDPVILAIGKQVFDADGKMLGRVIDLERKSNTNTYDSLIVRNKIWQKPFLVPKSDVKASKHNIMLKKAYGDEDEEQDNNK